MKKANKHINLSQGVNNNIAKGFSVLIFREFMMKLFSFFGQLVVTRLLLPSDFGIFVIISFIVNFFALFSDIGLYSALIQKHEEPTKKMLSTIFFSQMFLTLLLILIICLLAPFITIVYPQFTLNNIKMIQLFSLTLFITSLCSVPTALLERDIAYNKISFADLSGVVVYQIAVIAFALMGFSTWSLIYAVIIKEFVELAVIFYFKPFKPQFVFNIFEIIPMIRYGIFIQGGGALNFLYTSITPVIAGTMSGASAVGLLNWASGLSSVPESIATNFGRVAFANFSKIQKDTFFLKKSIERSIGVLSIITLFFTLIVLAFGKEFVAVLYTQKWQAGITSLYWFTASTFFIAVTYALAQGILAVGRSKDIFFITLFTTIFEWILAYFLVSKFGFVGIAITMTIISLLNFICYVFVAKKINLLPNLISTLLPKIVSVFALLLLTFFMDYLLPEGVVFLVIKICIIIFLYAKVMSIISKHDFEDVYILIVSELKIIKRR